MHKKEFLNILRDNYEKKRIIIKSRLNEFKNIGYGSANPELFEELTFCILAGGTSAAMALNSVCALSGILLYGDYNQIKASLKGYYRYPNMRAYHIVYTREYLRYKHDFLIRELLDSFEDKMELRRYLALNKNIMGIGFKEASHFLRNVGFSGFTILDKHIVEFMFQLKLISKNVIPSTEKSYLGMEEKLKKFSEEIKISIDELDLLLWSEKTGKILK